MRTINVVACYALVIVLTLLVPVTALVSDFTTIDVPGASSTAAQGINPRGGLGASATALGRSMLAKANNEARLLEIDPGHLLAGEFLAGIHLKQEDAVHAGQVVSANMPDTAPLA